MQNIEENNDILLNSGWKFSRSFDEFCSIFSWLFDEFIFFHDLFVKFVLLFPLVPDWKVSLFFCSTIWRISLYFPQVRFTILSCEHYMNFVIFFCNRLTNFTIFSGDQLMNSVGFIYFFQATTNLKNSIEQQIKKNSYDRLIKFMIFFHTIHWLISQFLLPRSKKGKRL